MRPTARLALVVAAATACGRVGFGAEPDAGAITDVPPCDAPPGLTQGLVGWWRFDEPSSAVAIDSAAGNDGLLLGGASRVAGHLGGAVALDGMTGRVDIAGNLAYATHAAQFSFSAWVDLADWSTTTPDAGPDRQRVVAVPRAALERRQLGRRLHRRWR